jgi:hypothetical protein
MSEYCSKLSAISPNKKKCENCEVLDITREVLDIIRLEARYYNARQNLSSYGSKEELSSEPQYLRYLNIARRGMPFLQTKRNTKIVKFWTSQIEQA